jgi:GAF domain-containing protein
MVDPHGLSRHLADAARDLQGETGAQDTMDKAVELAVTMIPSCESAGISMAHRGERRIDTPAATSPTALQVDELQYEFGQGPCLSAIHDEEVVYCRDLAREQRWDAWGPRTAEATGIRSMLCFRLFTNEHTVGALNLYASKPDAFDEEDRDHGLALAAHAAVAVAAAQEVDQLRIAVDGRTIIGQAQGILMERFSLSASQAFNVLVRVSSTTNTKVRDVSMELVRTRVVPGAQ